MLFKTLDYDRNLTNNELQDILNSYQSAKSKLIDINVIIKDIDKFDRYIMKYTILRLLYGSNSYTIANDYKSESKFK
jgi:hypothetical protein